jgi:hypothetical protein
MTGRSIGRYDKTHRWLSRPDVVPKNTRMRTIMPTKMTLKFSALSEEEDSDGKELSVLIGLSGTR